MALPEPLEPFPPSPLRREGGATGARGGGGIPGGFPSPPNPRRKGDTGGGEGEAV